MIMNMIKLFRILNKTFFKNIKVSNFQQQEKFYKDV